MGVVGSRPKSATPLKLNNTTATRQQFSFHKNSLRCVRPRCTTPSLAACPRGPPPSIRPSALLPTPGHPLLCPIRTGTLSHLHPSNGSRTPAAPIRSSGGPPPWPRGSPERRGVRRPLHGHAVEHAQPHLRAAQLRAGAAGRDRDRYVRASGGTGSYMQQVRRRHCVVVTVSDTRRKRPVTACISSSSDHADWEHSRAGHPADSSILLPLYPRPVRACVSGSASCATARLSEMIRSPSAQWCEWSSGAMRSLVTSE